MNPGVVVLFGLVGLLTGSVLTLVVYRVPRGITLFHPLSMCPDCAVEIGLRDNIPLASYALLRGRCRACDGRISLRYPLIEAGTALIWVFAALRFDSFEVATFVALASCVLVALALIDLEHRRIPNVMVLPSTVMAFSWVSFVGAAEGSWDPVIRAAACSAGVFAILFLIAIVSGGMGFGDVKLGAFIGVVAGRFDVTMAIAGTLAGFLLGGIVSAGFLVTRRLGRKDALPFGPAMAAGAMAALFAGESAVRGWLGL